MSYDFIFGHLKKMRYLSTKKTNTCGAGSCIEEKYGLSIVFAYEDSDIFHTAKLLNHGESCLCFVTEEPIGRGLKIYVLNQNLPLESENFKIFEGCFAQVEDCKKIKDTEEKPSYLIRGGLMSHQAMLRGSTELNKEVLMAEISYL